MNTREVLIVEDKEGYRNSIKRAFKEERYQFFEASNVEDGIVLLKQHPSIRVIILDLSFPENSGVKLLEWVRPHAPKYKVIVLTGHEELLKAENASDFEVFYYQAKAAKFSVQSIRFAIDHAFNDMESELLNKKISMHLEVQEKINANHQLEDVLGLICNFACDLVGGYTAHLRLFDLKKGDYILAGYDGPPHMKKIFNSPKKISESYSGRIAKENKPDVIDDLQEDPEFQKIKGKLLAGSGDATEVREYLETVRSAYIIPVSTGVFENEVDAVFNINSDRIAFFTPDKRKIIDDFVSQVNLAVAKDWLRSKRDEVHEDYSLSSNLLVQISDQLKGTNILENIYRIVIEGIAKIINPEMISIFIYSRRSGLLEKVAERVDSRGTQNLHETYAPGESLTGKVFDLSQTIRINDNPTQDPRYNQARKEIDLLKLPSRQIRHYLGVPLQAGNKSIGVIRTVNKKSGYYDELDCESIKGNEDCLLKRGFSTDCQTVLSIIASHLSVAIKNAELFNKLSGRIDQLQTLTQVARRVSSNYEMEIDDLLELIVRKTAEVTNSVICMLFLKDEYDANKVVLKQVYGISKSNTEEFFYELGEGQTGTVAKTGESILKTKVRGASPGKYDDLVLEALRGAGDGQASIESCMAVPIIIDESQVKGREIIGVLKVINKKHDHVPFDDDDVKVFETFASQIGVALAIAERGYALSQLVGGVCHEINNTSALVPPAVNKIRELLAPVDPEVSKRLERIYVVARQTVEFASDLLGFSESQMKEPTPTDINYLVEKALEYITPDTLNIDNYDRVAVLKRFSEEPILCNVNSTPLIHIIRNIVTNAYHAMEDEKDGQLEIRTYINHSGRVAHIEFSDNGRGIKKEHLPKIFRSDFSTKKGLKRNGLGLWLVKTYLHRMGGDISVTSEYGRGATFSIRIPAFI